MHAGRIHGAAALAAAALLTACAENAPSSEDAGAGSGTWTAVPSAPLSPRLGAVTAWTGSEALFLGGDVGDFCPPNAGCARPPESASDGAAYDPAQESWRPVADAPQPIEGGTPRTVAGDTVHLVQDDRLLSYDASEDAWSVSPPAPAGEVLTHPAVLGDGTVVVVDGERAAGEPSGLLYDPASRTWSELPEDPLGHAFDRFVTAIPGALVLTAASFPEGREDARPMLRAAVLDLATQTWTVLDDTERAGGWRWSWTGERMIDVYPDAQRGDGDRFAQGGALDPRTGSWPPLEGTPLMHTGGWPADAVGGPVAAVDGWVYDDRDRSWTLLPRPDGAPGEPGSAVWAGDELLVLGGMDTDSGWGTEHLSDGAWLWRPLGPESESEPEPESDLIAAADVEGAWVLAEGSVEGRPIVIPEDAVATLEFTGGRLRGTSFCNVYGSEYVLRGDRLVVDSVVSTLQACDAYAAETAYLEVLGSGDVRVSLRGGRLTLTSGRGALSFSRLPPVTVDDLTDRHWVLESPEAPGIASLDFRPDGTVDVATGCVEGTSSWQVTGDVVSIDEFGWSGLACGEAEFDRQGPLFDTWSSFRPTVEGDVLTLVPASAGSPTLVYRAG